MLRRPRKWLRQGRSWAWRRRQRGRVAHAVVLMYHRIARPHRDDWRLCVHPDRFDEQMRALRHIADIVQLESLRDSMRRRGEGRPVVAITFDDGYRDNLEVAKPILQRYEVPATVFLATGCIEAGEPYWWDSLDDAVLTPAVLPDELRLEGRPQAFVWERARETVRGSRVASSQDPASRRALRDTLWRWLVSQTDEHRRSALRAIRDWSGAHERLDPGAMPMSPAEVRALVDGGLVRAGAHSCSHAWLPSLDGDQLRHEIERSRRDCERLTGTVPDAFAYPFGELNEEVVASVRDAGFALACTSEPGLAWVDGEALTTPRIGVGDWSASRLRAYLRWYWFA